MPFDSTALGLREPDWTAADLAVLDLVSGFDPAPSRAKLPANLRWRRRTRQENAAAS
jgi:hypothetical protein